MATLVGYSDILVIQRKKHSGCIPAGIEWLLRYLKIPNVNLEAFQEQHDLGKNSSFSSVSKHVMSGVSNNIKLRDMSFSSAYFYWVLAAGVKG